MRKLSRVFTGCSCTKMNLVLLAYLLRKTSPDSVEFDKFIDNDVAWDSHQSGFSIFVPCIKKKKKNSNPGVEKIYG